MYKKGTIIFKAEHKHTAINIAIARNGYVIFVFATFYKCNRIFISSKLNTQTKLSWFDQ
jgi:hypothetical protein